MHLLLLKCERVALIARKTRNIFFCFPAPHKSTCIVTQITTNSPVFKEEIELWSHEIILSTHSFPLIKWVFPSHDWKLRKVKQELLLTANKAITKKRRRKKRKQQPSFAVRPYHKWTKNNLYCLLRNVDTVRTEVWSCRISCGNTFFLFSGTYRQLIQLVVCSFILMNGCWEKSEFDGCWK